jgi:hypothetical protein
MLEKIEAKLVPPERKWLRAIIHEGDAEAVVKEKQEKALAEHIAAHPEDAGRTVKDFKWIMMEILRPPPGWDGDVNPWYEQRKADAKRAAEAGGPHLSGEEAARPGDAAAGDGDGTDGADPYSERGRRNLAPDPDDDLADDECADPEDRPGQVVEVARRAFPPCSRYK